MIGCSLCPSNPCAQGHCCQCIGQNLSFLYDFLSMPGVDAANRVWQAWREQWLGWGRKNILPVIYGHRRRELGASRTGVYTGAKQPGLCIHNSRSPSVWRQKCSPCTKRLLLYYSGLLLEKLYQQINENTLLKSVFDGEGQSSLVSQFQSNTTL